MDKRAFLVDISDYKGDMKKYRIVGQLLDLMIRGVMVRGAESTNRYLHSDLEDEAVVEIVDQFHTAFCDLEGLQIEGLARLDTRFFINLRGLELSVLAANDEVYTIFIAFRAQQLNSAVLEVADLETVDDPALKNILSQLIEVEYSMVFPAFKDLTKNRSSE